MSDNHLFDMIEKKTGLKKENVFRLANSLQNANFRDEQTVRKIIRQIAKMANHSVSKAKEDRIVHTIVDGNVPTDLASLTDMLKR
ncbi:stage VI sporulation protein F [Pseudalkalibacillus decolorationis]|uniref:stage VI sporulation protein F n=1 Tax=Pseudalkalibacillus decolorationis TaxID=163879 RepID=UPI0021493D3E|nr:stage VI sporulation protein F [Pseudalkalibacillus decolorationis]